MKLHLFAFICLLAVLTVSCGTDETTDDTTQSDSSQTSTENDASVYADDLPEGLDFGGETVKILVGDVHAGTTYPTFYIEKEDGDVVNDAVYKRNRAVSERLNLSLEWEVTDFTYSTRDQYTNRVTNAIISNDGTMELLCGPGYYTTNLIAEKYFLDLNTVKYLDLEKPYWTDMYNRTATINNKIYSALGDFSLNKLMLSYVMFFNKNLFDQAGMEYPYETVLNGEWTLDVLEATVKDTHRDMNGNGVSDAGDIFGFQSGVDNNLWGFMDPCKVTVFESDAAGRMQFTMDSEHNVDAVSRLNAFLNNNPDVSHNNQDGMDTFIGGYSYITPGNLTSASGLRDLDFEYGILPYPKYSESDEHYITRTSSALSVFMIPITTEQTDKIGAFLEAMNAESAATVLPAYYETALKVKYLNDDSSVQVLDIINAGISIQFVDMYSQVFPSYSEIFRDTLAYNTANWSSKVAGIKKAANQKLEALMEFYYDT